MHFHLTEEQTAIQDAVRGTLARTWPMERIHAFADGADDLDPQSWKAMQELGIGDILTTDSGMGLLEAALVSEVVGEAAVPGPIIGQMLTVAALSACTDATTKALLPALSSGQTIATLMQGDSEFAPCSRSADLFLVIDRAAGVRLVSAADVDAIEALPSTDRTRPMSRVRIPEDAGTRLFASNDPMIARLTDAALVLVAADALGGAQKVTDLSVAYAKEREQFGQPIGQFQGLKHQLAHMALDVEPARALVWYAAYAWDAGQDDAPRAAAMAKAHLCDVYVRSTRAAVAAHGGIGYTWEYGLGYWLRRSLVDFAWLGRPAEHRARAADLARW